MGGWVVVVGEAEGEGGRRTSEALGEGVDDGQLRVDQRLLVREDQAARGRIHRQDPELQLFAWARSKRGVRSR